MKIIDFKKKGNIVRFYLGADDLKEWWGDDWNDRPYEYNAEQVYDEYVSGHKDVSFPFDWIVLEPRDGTLNSEWSKEDMIKRTIPCIIAVPPEVQGDSWDDESFAHWVGSDRVSKYYFGDKMEVVGVAADENRNLCLVREA